jgi:hypothetical protein
MKRTSIGLAASAAILSISAGAFAAAGLDGSDGPASKGASFQMAQAGGDTAGNATSQNNGGGAATAEPDEQLIGSKRKSVPGSKENMTGPDTTGSIGADTGAAKGSGTPENPHDQTGTSSGDQTGNQIK